MLLEDISKTRLRPDGGVTGRLKMLTYYRVCCAFSPPRAPDDKLGIYDLPSSLIHIFEIASNIMRLILIAETKRNRRISWPGTGTS